VSRVCLSRVCLSRVCLSVQGLSVYQRSGSVLFRIVSAEKAVPLMGIKVFIFTPVLKVEKSVQVMHSCSICIVIIKRKTFSIQIFG
jgi:hypothetical protein